MNVDRTPSHPLVGRANFEGPWQAQAFAIVVRLNATGHFEWDDWVRTFSQEIARSPALPGESTSDAYYRQWTTALETLLVSRGTLDEGDAAERASVWREAYINTPHGQPVLLGNAYCPPDHDHGHDQPHARDQPVAVSAAID